MTREQLEDLLKKIRIGLKSDAGDIEIDSYEENKVSLKLTEICATCLFKKHSQNRIINLFKKTYPEAEVCFV